MLESTPSTGLTGLLHRGVARRAERRIEDLRLRVRTTAARLRRIERLMAESALQNDLVLGALTREAA